MHNRSMGHKTRLRRESRTIVILVEQLEARQLFTITVDPMLTLSPAATNSVSGYTPSQIQQAYGYNLLSGDGTGQTIAIVDAYRDPNIASDLHVFDQKFGLSDPTLSVVSQTGGSGSTVKADSGWSTEIALDVEWAHAMAPNAKILLVEANSSSITDLMAGVNYARNAAGVSVVSMSWGGSEFWGQQQYDSIFTTPAGHQGVTFVAASGDSGSWYGPMWPASSPNVLAVGGTVLHLNATGGYGYETGWSYSTGGISSVESEPSYQLKAQSTGGRTTPDVSFNASGFALYSSVPDQGISGWSIVGGTSVGAPTWAALIAIADQLRVAAGKATLDGASGTLPALYAAYSPFGTVAYSTYTALFHDITSGASSYFLAAHYGYDGVTGLGSPNAGQVVAQLVAAGSATSSSAIKTAAVSSAAKPAVARQTAVPAVAVAAPQANPIAALPVIHSLPNTLLAQVASAQISVSAPVLGMAAGISSPFYQGVNVTSDHQGTGSGPIEIESTPAAAPALKAAFVAPDGVIPALASVAAPRFEYVNALAQLSAADGISSLVRESATLGAAISSNMLAPTTRAGRITLLTMAADVLVTGLWAAHIIKKRRKARRPAYRYDYPVDAPENDEQDYWQRP